ncbi:MAG: response regulator [Anaerolineales bacterium]|nr:response regulator [Anaerolineales bacterium]
MEGLNIRSRILAPIIVVMVLFLIGGIVGITRVYQEDIENHIQVPITNVIPDFQHELQENAELMMVSLDFIENDPCVQAAWLAQDRAGLLNCSIDIYQNLRTHYEITQFYFHGLNRINFLRVHNPELYGDFINRYTLNEAASTGEVSWGIELGSYGSFALRVVKPWFIDGTLVGYVELDEEINEIIPAVTGSLDVDIVFLINKNLLNRENWEKGREEMGYDSNWDQFFDFVVIDQSMILSEPALQIFVNDLKNQSETYKTDLRIGDQHYRMGSSPLEDASGNDVGRILVFRNISEKKTELQKILFYLITLTVILGVFLFYLFWYYLGRVEKRYIKDSEDRRNTEFKLLQSDIRYRAIFNGVEDAIIVLSLEDGKVMDVNKKACEIFGYKREKFLEKTLKDYVSEEYLEKGRKVISGELPSNRAYECINIKADGTRFPVSTTMSINTVAGESRILSVVRDITEQKAIETELIRARSEAEAATQAKSEFLANMSHEIRTPLNAIYGMAGLLEETPLNNEQRDFLDTIRGGSETLLTVINDILDYSKIEAGKMELELRPFSLRDCVETVLDLLAEKAGEKELELGCVFSEDVPHVILGDVTRLRQILVNLIGNAIKFTEKGEVALFVESLSIEGQATELTFRVRDTGIGIPEDMIHCLFQSFSQVDTSTTRKYGGTGLGLAISSQLVKQMGGKIWVESEEGKGSFFCFTIPVEVDTSAPSEIPLENQSTLIGKRILIVDDNETNRLILIKQTKPWGMIAHAYASGQEALSAIEDGMEYDVAILDMKMPQMDGFQLAQEIKDRKDTVDVPVIILSSMMRTHERGSDPEVYAFLNKPIKTSSLYDMLISSLGEGMDKSKKGSQERIIDPSLGETIPLNILLAEDNLINQKIAKNIFKRMGYEIKIVNNGLEALEALEKENYDVVFMDIQMPKMDGETAVKEIRKRWPREKQTWIVAMTAHALEGDRERFLEMGMDDYVAKPIRIEELERAIKNVGSK